MKKLLSCLVAVLLFLPLAALAQECYVDGLDADRVHLRISPNVAEESMGLYFTGTPVVIESEWNDWRLVRIGAVDGWMREEYLGGSEFRRQMPVYHVQNPGSSWVNLRSAPGLDADVLAQVENYERVVLLGETANGWSFVEYGSQTGYMVSDFLERGDQVSVTKIVGTTGDGDFIHVFEADNRQNLYFTAMEEYPYILREDVNFDGMNDYVVHVTLGASNFFSEFFVRQGDNYVRAEHPGIDYGVCNYSLIPERGYVVSRANNGSAGALHETCIFQWNGTKLHLVRQAVAEERTEWESFSDRFVETT